MSLWKIAWRSIQRRGLASMLTALSMALGVMLVVGVLVIYGIVSESFRNNSNLGYEMIIGANKGGKLQIVMNSVFYLSEPAENIRDYNFYLDFLDKEARGDGRDGKWKDSVNRVVPVCLGDYFKQYRVVGTTPDMFTITGDDDKPIYRFASGENFKTKSEKYGFFEAVVGARVAREYDLKVGDAIVPTHGSEAGAKHDDFFIAGILESTGTPADRAVFVNMEGFFLLDGHAKVQDEEEVDIDETESDSAPIDTEHEPTDLGAVQSAITKSEAPESEAPESEAPESEAPESEAPESEAPGSHSPVEIHNSDLPYYRTKTTPLPFDQREVTALLVRAVNPFVVLYMENKINEGNQAQAVLPVKEITSLFQSIVSPIQTALLAMTAMICLVSGIGIMVSIYNSMSDRNREIAIMRSLGAGRRTVMVVVLLEAVMLALGGGLLGWIGGHVAIAISSPAIERETGVQVGLFDFAPPIMSIRYSEPIMDLENLTNDTGKKILDILLSPELLLIPTIILLAILVGFLPALTAYKTDVAKSLSANP